MTLQARSQGLSLSMEEALRGRLAVLARRSAGEERERAYAKLMETVRFFGSIQVGLFDARCEEQYQALKAQRVRVGTQDLRIAAIALAHGFTVGEDVASPPAKPLCGSRRQDLTDRPMWF